MQKAMIRRMAKILGVAIALCFALQIAFMPGMTGEAFAFGRNGGGHVGGGHFGGGHFGGGHFGGGHFGGGHFGHFGGRHFGGMHFGGRHFAGRHFGGRHFGRGHVAHGLTGRRFGRAGSRHGTALAHNQLGRAGLGRFHSIHGFARHGFNRNAFGSMAGWNRWAGSNWGAGWNYWGYGWGYWAGPVFWPFFYGDVLTFALWPYDLYDPFFAYGPDFLFASIFWPGPLYGPYDYGYYPLFDVYGDPLGAGNYYGYYHGRQHRQHRRHAVAAASSGAGTSVTASCSALAPGVADLPIERIKKAIKPTDQQMDMLNQLQAASTKANATLRASCPSEVPLTPVSQLEAVDTRLHAMSKAVQILRAPLTTFYNSLDDKQKDQLAALGKRGKRGLAVKEAPAHDLAALCKQQAASFTLLPVQRIEDTVKPTAQEKTAFEALKSASTKAAANLDASCPSDVPETLADRLDAVGKRLDALAEAVAIVKPALTDFYDTLNDEQKARFNVIGSAANAAPAPQGKTKTGG